MELLKLAALLACACNYAVQSLYFLHMLQLNSYRPERYRKWCVENSNRLASTRLFPALLFLAAFLPPLYCLPAAVVVLVC